MIRAVLDANIFVSSLIEPRGNPARIFRGLIENQSFELVLSPPILEEIRRVLKYPRLRKHLASDSEEIEEYLLSLGLIATLVEGKRQLQAIEEDPEDDKYLACALEASADYIVSGDEHLLAIEEYEGIRIVSPQEFVKIIN
jgi:putative PIN family toxin of toxin-antitoxin system